MHGGDCSTRALIKGAGVSMVRPPKCTSAKYRTLLVRPMHRLHEGLILELSGDLTLWLGLREKVKPRGVPVLRIILDLIRIWQTNLYFIRILQRIKGFISDLPQLSGYSAWPMHRPSFYPSCGRRPQIKRR